MAELICVNGEFFTPERARLSVFDRGFLFGYGLFETILVRGGRPVFLFEHLARLEAGCAALKIACPLPFADVRRLAEETARKNGLGEGALRLTVSAGADPPGEVPGTLVISPRPLPYGPQDYRRGFTAGWAAWRRNERSPLVTLKTLNYLENLLARREARQKKKDEAIFLNTAGGVAEGSASNIFVVKEGRVATPSVDQGLLPGIMRRAVLETCRLSGIPAQERPVTPEEVLRADECFLTNSLFVVMPLVELDGFPIGSGRPGAITGQIRAAVLERME